VRQRLHVRLGREYGGMIGHDNHAFCDEEELERFYKTQRQSPVLGGERFVERVRGRLGKVAREHPRYERAKVEIRPQEIIRTVARMYKVEEAEVLRGNRGRENQARKVAMYLVRRCCDKTLEETAQFFGVRSYGTVGWACHGVQSKVEGEREFRDRVEKIIQRTYQPKDLTPKRQRTAPA
jgi:hypothetical protein